MPIHIYITTNAHDHAPAVRDAAAAQPEAESATSTTSTSRALVPVPGNENGDMSLEAMRVMQLRSTLRGLVSAVRAADVASGAAAQDMAGGGLGAACENAEALLQSMGG